MPKDPVVRPFSDNFYVSPFCGHYTTEVRRSYPFYKILLMVLFLSSLAGFILSKLH